MKEILDNPIYHALISGNKNFSLGNDEAKFFPENISPLAGLREYSRADLNILFGISPVKSLYILFTLDEFHFPSQWKVFEQMKILQMVYDNPVQLTEADLELVTLREQHVPSMLALTKMMNPGPFLSATIRFGNYKGIFDGSRLVAMAGQRLRPDPYAEVSAVCTHPDYFGKGYAKTLISDQVRDILGESGIPFLHVRAHNSIAIRLYQKLGFTTRRGMIAYVIQKQAMES